MKSLGCSCTWREHSKNGVWLWAVVVLHLRAFGLFALASMAKPGCEERCGDMEIPYPFGMGDEGCFVEGFGITCNRSVVPSKALLGKGNLQVINISLANAEVRVNNTRSLSYSCRNGNRDSGYVTLSKSGPYTFSNKTVFTAIGCDTVGYVTDNDSFTSGCVSKCMNQSTVVNGSCNGIGCCQTTLPKHKKYLLVSATSLSNYTSSKKYSWCSYAFLAERESYNFRGTDLRLFLSKADLAIVLDWEIRNGSCLSTANSSSIPHVCGENAECIDSERGIGYVCRCIRGYEGNPYLSGGCQDINECLSRGPDYKCFQEATCENIGGNYSCICPKGHRGDGLQNGSQCRPDAFPIFKLILGAGLGLGFLLAFGFGSYLSMKKIKLVKLREHYFKQNGGLLLRRQISSHEDSTAARIFTSDDLKKATNNYDKSKILGAGGYGTVYKGTLEDSTVVAIKKANVVDKVQIDQFINEVLILTQVNHRNVVKLLGCCLETSVPMLIYEYIPNGTLEHHIHGKDLLKRISWPDRLRIALETAEALAYLHSAASMPIFHRDVKSANILLDNNGTAKVGDFGISRMVPIDKTQLSTLVQGTLGYLDPEYFQTGQLTAKSDVYSFGVILLELLTGERPFSFERSKEEANLANYFLMTVKNGHLEEILEKDVLREGNIQQLRGVADLAVKCQRLNGEKRPTMKEVVQELMWLKGSTQHAWLQKNIEETEHLLGHDPPFPSDEVTGSLHINVGVLALESGR
ncbi:wall-associated receptor kinase 2 [Amborella trichopoda]|uniref:Protein kinase domain-containing protein n=1 Tax=Amborella trichopoda TaxID=13333 RepID=W1PW09_AMBTC|nr:wall-associated receptor kinase 2 [Amborella trichopoda]ERN11490.1 hypothetical protein AMTR_s00022p00101660 [Amborella trichopoda]|eukprot:XP_006849909.3 wall-associated receptor kinase 2 [Amborella trichopoda]